MNYCRPHHLYVDGWCYFITARCVDKICFWKKNEDKDIFVNVLCRSLQKFEVEMFAWVLLHNHYHLMIKVKHGKDVGRFVNNLHSNSARLINKKYNLSGRKIWYQYWDYCIRTKKNKKDFWSHFNYIIQNPLKHHLVRTLREAYDYQYSSNPVWLDRFGEDGLSESFVKFPVKDWAPSGD